MADPVIRTILCPTDFSVGAESALRHALFFARTFGAKLCLVHVDDASAMELPGTSGLEEDRRDRLRAELDALAERHADEGAEIEVELLHGSPDEAIVAHAALVDADLVVLGTKGRTGLSRVLVGSVAERVVRHCPVPVITVRSAHHETPPAGLPIG